MTQDAILYSRLFSIKSSFITTLEFVFRLDKNHDGQAVLSGNIQSDRGVNVVSRTILFSYEMNRRVRFH